MKQRCIVDKKRESYKKENMIIEIDFVKKLGLFVEIELMREKEKKAQQQIMKIFSEIGVKTTDIVSGLGYPDLIEKKQSEDKGDFFNEEQRHNWK